MFWRLKKGEKFKCEVEYSFKRLVNNSASDQYFILDKLGANDELGQLTDKGIVDSDGRPTVEDREVIRTHKVRERDSRIFKAAINRALRLYGKLECEAYGFDFERRYGELGKEFLEGQHKQPLSLLSTSGGETRVEDIALLCSNCHRMIHRQLPWLTVEELKENICD